MAYVQHAKRLITVSAAFLGTLAGVPAARGQLPPIASGPGITTPCSFSIRQHGFVSLALYDETGVLRRTLLSAEPMGPGDHTIVWDGTTDMGLPAAPGKYTPKGIFFTEAPKIHYVLKIGKSGNPPWRTADGKGDWGGNLGMPSGIAASEDTVFLTWSCVEDNQITGVQQVDGQGNVLGRYYTFYPWDMRMAAAMEGKNFYL
jgi:hypothetical protein